MDFTDVSRRLELADALRARARDTPEAGFEFGFAALALDGRLRADAFFEFVLAFMGPRSFTTSFVCEPAFVFAFGVLRQLLAFVEGRFCGGRAGGRHGDQDGRAHQGEPKRCDASHLRLLLSPDTCTHSSRRAPFPDELYPLPGAANHVLRRRSDLAQTGLAAGSKPPPAGPARSPLGSRSRACRWAPPSPG